MKKLYIFSLCFMCCLSVFAIENPIKNPTFPLNFPVVAVSNPTVTEGSLAVFVISLSSANTAITTINVTTTTGTAGTLDFTTVSTTVSIPIGATSVLVSVPTIDDTISESTETFTLSATVQSSNTVNTIAAGTGTIVDNDPPLPTLAIADKTVPEGSIAYFEITLSAPSNVPTVIFLKTFTENFQIGQAGTNDFISVATNVTIPVGATSINFPITTYYDIFYEGNETFKLTGTVLSSNTENIVATGTGIIIDNQQPLYFSLNNVTVTEGNPAVFVVSISGPSNTPTVINITTQNGTATNSDYTPVTQTLTIPAGATSVSCNISTIHDFIIETTETFTVNAIVTSTNTTNNTTNSICTITDNPKYGVIVNGTYNDFNNDNFTNIGDVINVQFTVLNNTINTITNVSVSSNQMSVNGTIIPSLPTGASNVSNYVGVYTINQMDINNGFVSITASTSGTSSGAIVSGSSSNTIPLNITKGFKLNAFIDSNGNGFQDGQEFNFSNGTFKYQMNNGVLHNINSSNGIFYLYETNPNNIYTLSYTNTNNTFNCYGQFNVTIPTYNNVTIGNLGIVTYNFALTAVTCADLAVYLSNYNEPPRPGFVYDNRIIYRNQGNQTIASGVVTFTKSNIVTVLSTSPSTTPTTEGFTYNFSNLLPGETRYINIEMQMPVIPIVSLGQIVTNDATISVPSNDIYTNNNASVLSQVIVGSYDPNDKAETHGPKILHSSFTANDYLNYKIQFENTGTANAITVKVNDILHPKLDETTLQMVDASHNYVLDRTGSNLEWKFSGINLPPSVANTQIGHGYIMFRIKPKTGYVIGDIIPNTANIYFDFNPAIVTNTWTTEFVASLGNASFDFKDLKVYPNPTTAILSIENNKAIDSIVFTNVLGQTILTKTCSDLQNLTDISNFINGVYFVKITSGESEKVIKIVKQ